MTSVFGNGMSWNDVQRFGTNLGSELGYRSEPVLRPKPRGIFNTRSN